MALTTPQTRPQTQTPAELPFTEEAFMAAVCEGKVLVVGRGLEVDALHLLSSPLLAGVALHVSERLPATAWAVY